MYGIKQAKKETDKLTKKSLDRFLILYNPRQIYLSSLSAPQEDANYRSQKHREVEGEWKMDEPQPKSPVSSTILSASLPCMF
jgi:hypothetical protein